MRVSVVIAAYNCEAYVAQAVDSVLNQSRPPHEIIVIDDGSVDGTRAILEGFGSRINLMTQPNRGQAAALNTAIATATGDLLGFCDADDLWLQSKLELQIAVIEGSEEIDAVFGGISQFVSPDVPKDQQDALRPVVEVVEGGSKICMLIRKPVFDELGAFDELLPATFFFEWLGRAKMRGLRSGALDEIVALRRLHLANGGRLDAKSQDRETLLALRQVILKRRLKP